MDMYKLGHTFEWIKSRRATSLGFHRIIGVLERERMESGEPRWPMDIQDWDGLDFESCLGTVRQELHPKSDNLPGKWELIPTLAAAEMIPQLDSSEMSGCSALCPDQNRWLDPRTVDLRSIV